MRKFRAPTMEIQKLAPEDVCTDSSCRTEALGCPSCYCSAVVCKTCYGQGTCSGCYDDF